MKLTDEEIRLAEYRALREESWRLVRDDLARLRGDVGLRGVGDRIRDRIGEGAAEVMDYTREVAAEHRGIVAATVAALVAWILRDPIVGLFRALGGGGRDDDYSDDTRTTDPANVDPTQGENT